MNSYSYIKIRKAEFIFFVMLGLYLIVSILDASFLALYIHEFRKYINLFVFIGLACNEIVKKKITIKNILIIIILALALGIVARIDLGFLRWVYFNMDSIYLVVA